jgi:hypothetical protein
MAETITSTNGTVEDIRAALVSVQIDAAVHARLGRAMTKHRGNLGTQTEIVTSAVTALVERLEALDAEPSFLERVLSGSSKPAVKGDK